MNWLDMHKDNGSPAQQVLSYTRELAGDKILVINNISDSPIELLIPSGLMITPGADMLGNAMVYKAGSELLQLPAWGYAWIKL
jgi:hypothetical protein